MVSWSAEATIKIVGQTLRLRSIVSRTPASVGTRASVRVMISPEQPKQKCEWEAWLWIPKIWFYSARALSPLVNKLVKAASNSGQMECSARKQKSPKQNEGKGCLLHRTRCTHGRGAAAVIAMRMADICLVEWNRQWEKHEPALCVSGVCTWIRKIHLIMWVLLIN